MARAPVPAPSACAGASCSIFTLGSLTLSAFLAVTTYGLVRSNLIEQRYSASRQAAYTHAQVVQRELRGGPGDAPRRRASSSSSSACSAR